MRTPIIAGNWKMNKTPEETIALINGLKPLVADAKAEVVVCPPFVCLPAAVEAVKGSNIQVGAQNVHFKASGAYTAEISVEMLQALQISYVIVGHSERRQYFGETDKVVNLRALAALEGGITPIICVGELLEEREAGITHAVVEMQTRLVMANMTKEQAAKCVIAYELCGQLALAKLQHLRMRRKLSALFALLWQICMARIQRIRSESSTAEA